MFVKAPQLWRDEDGVNTLEYALLLALIAAAGVAAYDKIGSLMRDSVTQTTAEMSAEQAGL
jgi:Flp pilus assembly pilin Flp